MNHESLTAAFDEFLVRSEIALEPNPQLAPDPNSPRSLNELFAIYARSSQSLSDPALHDRLADEIFGEGPLRPLLEDSEITEILVNGPFDIWFERRGRLQMHADRFVGELSYRNFCERVLNEAKVQVSVDRPTTDGRWRDFRLHAVAPPVAPGAVHFTLRRQARASWSLERLMLAGWADGNAIKIIADNYSRRKSMLIVGSTGSGKTSVLNACLSLSAPDERLISIEDTDEIELPNRASVKLLSRVDPNGLLASYDQTDLLRHSLRMRPDRLIVGEVRGPEAKDLLMALSTGHSGGISTLHADNARQALIRLEMLIQLGAPQWSLAAIRHLILLGIDSVLVVKKENGARFLESISRLTSLEETGFCLEPLWLRSTTGSTPVSF